MKVLGIIPARGGSKAIPDKNIVPVGGRPLIEWTIACAKNASKLDRCIVSTDSQKIADVAKSCGADVPFLRPPELAQDDTPTLQVVLHVLQSIGSEYDAIMILQPTSPFRLPEDVDAAVELLDNDEAADSVISVVPVGDHHPARMKFIEDGVLVDPPFAEATEGQPRQELPELFLRNGAIYLTRSEVVSEKGSFKGGRSLALVMPQERSINVDEPLDLQLCEAVLMGRKSHE